MQVQLLDLHNALKNIKTLGITSRPANPVIGGVRIQNDGSQRTPGSAFISISAFNYDTSATFTIPAKVSPLQKFNVLVSHADLAGWVAQLKPTAKNNPAVAITIGETVRFDCSGAVLTLEPLQFEDCPNIPEVDGDFVEVAAANLARVAKRAGAVADLAKNTIGNPIFAGVHIDWNSRDINGDADVFATDKVRLAWEKLPCIGGFHPEVPAMVVDAKLLAKMAPMFIDSQVKVQWRSAHWTADGVPASALPEGVSPSGTWRFTSSDGAVDFTLTQITGGYPQVQGLFCDKVPAAQVRVCRKTLLDTLKMAATPKSEVGLDFALRSSDQRGVGHLDSVKVFTSNPDSELGFERTISTAHTGTPMEVWVKPQYLIDGLQMLTCEFVTLKLNHPLKPVEVCADEDPMRYIFVPYRIAGAKVEPVKNPCGFKYDDGNVCIKENVNGHADLHTPKVTVDTAPAPNTSLQDALKEAANQVCQTTGKPRKVGEFVAGGQPVINRVAVARKPEKDSQEK
jgi:DNA polymerase III sliding clamp (beta) subunit (PCNA family)